MCPWVIKNQLPGATICCQNAPVVISHKDNKLHKILHSLWTFNRVYFTCFHNKYFKEKTSLCVLTLLLSGYSELNFENCPWFIWNCPWFMPNSHEPGTILKCKLPLVHAGLFQGLVSGVHSEQLLTYHHYPAKPGGSSTWIAFTSSWSHNHNKL